VKAWAKTLHDDFDINITIPQNTKFSPPEWICIQKKHAKFIEYLLSLAP